MERLIHKSRYIAKALEVNGHKKGRKKPAFLKIKCCDINSGSFSGCFYNHVECSRIAECQLGQSLSVHLNSGFVCQINEPGVGKSSFSHSSVDSLNPQSTHISLFSAPVIEGMESCLHHSNACKSIETVATSAVALRLSHQSLSAILMKCAVFSSHYFLPVQFPLGSKFRISFRSASAT